MLRSRRQEGLASTNGVVPAAAQDYPSRPVTIVVGYTPGATSDLVARTIGEWLNAAWGQSVIVDNRSGRPPTWSIWVLELSGDWPTDSASLGASRRSPPAPSCRRGGTRHHPPGAPYVR